VANSFIKYIKNFYIFYRYYLYYYARHEQIEKRSLEKCDEVWKNATKFIIWKNFLYKNIIIEFFNETNIFTYFSLKNLLLLAQLGSVFKYQNVRLTCVYFCLFQKYLRKHLINNLNNIIIKY
jgi:hypothetical protein